MMFFGFYFAALILLFFYIQFSLFNIVFALEKNNEIVFEKLFLKTDESGYAHLFGQIKNNIRESISNVTIEATFYDSNNKTIGKYERNPELSIIDYNKTSPFEILYLDTDSSKNIKNFTLSVKNKDKGIAKEKSLLIESFSSRPDISGFFYINGQIKNNGDSPSTNTMIIATFYNKEGNIIGIAKALVEPINIGKGKNGGFGLVFVEKDVVFKIKNFALNAFSDQYLSEQVVK